MRQQEVQRSNQHGKDQHGAGQEYRAHNAGSVNSPFWRSLKAIGIHAATILRVAAWRIPVVSPVAPGGELYCLDDAFLRESASCRGLSGDAASRNTFRRGGVIPDARGNTISHSQLPEGSGRFGVPSFKFQVQVAKKSETWNLKPETQFSCPANPYSPPLRLLPTRSFIATSAPSGSSIWSGSATSSNG